MGNFFRHLRAYWMPLGTALGLWLLFLPNLGVQPFWVDETIAALPARSVEQFGYPLVTQNFDFMRFQNKDGVMDPATPLYRYALGAFTAVVGFDRTTTRLFSALLTALAAGLLGLLAWQLGLWRSWYLAPVLYLGHAATVEQARIARHFSAVHVALLLCAVAFEYYRRRRSDSARIVLVATVLLASLVHNIAWIAFPAIGLLVLLTGLRRFCTPRALLTALLLLGCMLLVWVPYAETLAFFHTTDCSNRPLGCANAQPLFYLTTLSRIVAFMAVRDQAWFLGLGLGTVVSFLGARAVWRGRYAHGAGRELFQHLCVWVVLPLAYLWLQDVQFSRYLWQTSAPWLLLLPVAYFQYVWPVAWRRTNAMTLVALGLLWFPQLDTGPNGLASSRYLRQQQVQRAEKDNFERIGMQAEMVRRLAKPGDVFVTVFDGQSLQYETGYWVWDMLHSRNTDAFLVGLVQDAQRRGATVWFFDHPVGYQFCQTDETETRAIDCREKYSTFFALCADPESVCRHVRVDEW